MDVALDGNKFGLIPLRNDRRCARRLRLIPLGIHFGQRMNVMRVRSQPDLERLIHHHHGDVRNILRPSGHTSRECWLVLSPDRQWERNTTTSSSVSPGPDSILSLTLRRGASAVRLLRHINSVSFSRSAGKCDLTRNRSSSRRAAVTSIAEPASPKTAKIMKNSFA